MKKLLAVFLVLAMMFTLAACGGNSGEAEDNVFEVGTSADYPPYEFIVLDESGTEQFVGADMELAKLIAEKLGKELKITNMSFDGLLGSLAEGQFDCVIAGLTNDPAREVLFSKDYYTRGQVCIINKASEATIKTAEDLKGLKVSGQTGTVQEQMAKELAGDSAVAVQNFNDQVMMLQSGQIDAIISDSDVAAGYVAVNSDDLMIAAMEIPYENQGVAIAFQLGNDAMCEQVNAVLDELMADGTIEQLMADASKLQLEEAEKKAAEEAE